MASQIKAFEVKYNIRPVHYIFRAGLIDRDVVDTRSALCFISYNVQRWNIRDSLMVYLVHKAYFWSNKTRMSGFEDAKLTKHLDDTHWWISWCMYWSINCCLIKPRWYASRYQLRTINHAVQVTKFFTTLSSKLLVYRRLNYASRG